MRQNSKALLPFLLIISISPACKTNSPASTLRETDEINAASIQAAPLFIVMGGYNSCGRQGLGRTIVGMSLDQSFSVFNSGLQTALRDRLAGEKGARSVAVLRTCFEAGNGNVLHRRASDETTDTLQNLALLTRAEDRAAGGIGISNRPDGKMLEAFFAALLAEIKRLDRTETGTSRPVFFMGHSHGGWLAMQLAMRAADKVPVKGILTIDPISRIHCSPSDYGVTGSAAGCTEFPRDLTPEIRRSLALAVPLWRNFYQSNTANLHSGAADEATFAEQLLQFSPPEPRTWAEGGAHTSLPRDRERVWAKWNEDVRTSLQLAPEREAPAENSTGAVAGLNLTEAFRFNSAGWSWNSLSGSDKAAYEAIHGEPNPDFPLWAD